MQKSHKTILILVPVALVLGFVFSSWMHQAQSPPKVQTSDPLLANGMRIDASMTGLVDTQGRPADDSQFAGHYRLVAFGFTACPDVCPTMLLGMRQALEELGPDAASIAPVFISVDPERDTPERIGAYVDSFDPRIEGFTGSHEALQRVAKNYRVHYARRALSSDASPSDARSPKDGKVDGAEPYTVDHTAMIYLIDSQQRIRALIPTSEGPEKVALEVVRAYRVLAQIAISQAWARATPPAAPAGAAYLALTNNGTADDKLMMLEAPVAGRVEIHSTSHRDGMMRMNAVREMPLPSKQTVKLVPGGSHIMLFDLKQPLVAGQSFPLKLSFANAPAVTVDVKIAGVGAGDAKAASPKSKHSDPGH